ncbi:MAG: aldehyde dehydrogenase family protein, partial [Chloroflexota bacterium]|nr:aldehyde dehydrogenase family protein [Chloroflexota bacterium]
MPTTYPFYLAGKWESSDAPLTIRNPFNDECLGTTFQASADQLDRAITAAESAFISQRRMPTFERSSILRELAARLKQRRDEVAEMICREAGKPIREAEVETDRGVFTLEIAAEEAKRIDGEVIPLDLLAASQGRFG